jgi:creatinine amidohydrolase/Fe(II)-dependent formamide hydrolase-like protein
MDKPGCYIQNTVRAVQNEKKLKNDIVLIPLGSTEVHGFHCASSQDTLQAARICEALRRYTARQGREVNLAFSPWFYGNHPKHHVGMIGTIPISPSLLERTLVDVMFGLWADGYRKFIFVNNHAQHWVIAAAIEEQSVVTRDVASNIAQASMGVKDSNDRVAQTATVSQSIAEDIAHVNMALGEISRGGEQVQSSSAELADLASQLREMVGRFRV